MPLKVLHIINSLNPGGKERQFVELMKIHSLRNDIDLHIIIFNNSVHYNLDFINKNKIHFFPRRKKMDLSVCWKIYKLCIKIKPNIIHSWELMCTIYSLPISKLLRINLVNGSVRNALPLKSRTILNRIIRKMVFHFSDIIISNSLAGLRAYNPPSRKSMCIYNGFDSSRIKNLDDREIIKKKFNIRTDNIVGMVANCDDRKDYTTFIQAACIVMKKNENTTFLAIGDGKNLENWEKMIKPEYKQKIIFMGLQNGVESIVNIFNVGVLSTNTLVHREGISNAIMEYMVLGKPVVATDSGGTPELVKDMKTGFLVEPMNSVQLAEKIVYLLENKKSAEKLGKGGQVRIRSKFSFEELGDKYFNCYRSLVK